MLFQIQSEFAAFILGIVFSIIIFAIGILVMRWYTQKKNKSYEEFWDTSLKTAFKLNLILLLIDLPIVILYNFLFAENLPLNLIFQFYIYFIINLFTGTIAVTKIYRKKLGEAFDFVVPVQIILLVIALVLVFLKFLMLIPPYIFLYIILTGLPNTLLLTALGLLFGFILGLTLALMRIYGSKELMWLASGYEKILRGIPILVLIFILAFGIPMQFFWFIDPLQRPLFSVILALALRSAAYQSQIFRGAILSVNPGQMEASLSLGMNKFKAFRHIIFPQALRLAVPSWSNEYAVVLKDSSFAYAVGVIEMTKAAYRVSSNFPELWALSMGIVAIAYFLFTFPVTKLFGERQTKKLKELGMGGG
ncbi:MAG: amino acid ABC transporter permease [Candidatus Hodarchaeota archaeon]